MLPLRVARAQARPPTQSPDAPGGGNFHARD